MELGNQSNKKLIRHELNFQLACNFLREELDQTNELSCQVVNGIRFEKGSFFTLLPYNAHVERLHLFQSYILQQNPRIEYGDESKKSVYQNISTIRDDLSHLMNEILIKNKTTNMIIDDFEGTYQNGYADRLFSLCGMHYEKEIYYLFNKLNISQELLIDCLDRSNTFWHSLCVLTEANFDDVIDKKLTLEKIKEICQNAQLVIIGAYDGEGYIFWEPKRENVTDQV